MILAWLEHAGVSSKPSIPTLMPCSCIHNHVHYFYMTMMAHLALITVITYQVCLAKTAELLTLC